MATTILTKRQHLLLELFFAHKDIQSQFYLSGGTALAEYYLHHRYSKDLDFFSKDEVNPFAIQVVIKSITPEAKIQKVDFQQSYNRNLYFLHFKDEVIKTEFTYYPFLQIEQPVSKNNIKIDSLIDIAANKAFTIYQNPRSRDFIDLYLLIQKKRWKLSEVLKQAQIKFDTYIDPLQLGQQLLQVTELKDYPRMILQVPSETWHKFWLKEAEKLKDEAIK